ncbi:endonuclease/exonuclease/phosphatase family protein [Longispora albida]|uniref:endonuclease/exonuclease/phosphatase family protein n=1 Tax=Longispora albida TaxID=203523 RepID=UPI00039DA937|nr:endonuclease/exonuclease/phosphatase family protein [Longispora albida]
MTVRKALGALAWAGVAVMGAFTLVRLFGWEAGWPLRPLMAYTPYIALGVLAPLALALALRNWRATAAALVVAATLAVLVVPRWLPGGGGEAAGPRLTILSMNLLAGSADLDTVAELAKRADVLSVQELTPQADAVIAPLFPYRVALPEEQVSGTGLYAKHPLTRLPALEPPGTSFRMPAARLDVPGAPPVELLAVHPIAPMPDYFATWVAELEKLPAATPDGGIRILAGDFNATLDHALLRDLLGTGYRDAAAAIGRGYAWTWPNQPEKRGGVPLPPVTIDHVLIDERVAVEAIDVLELPGSDHRPVLAGLRLPRRA